MDVTVVSLNASKLKTSDEIHDFLQSAFELPEYYGRNLDAFYDCMSECFDKEYLISVVNISSATEYFETLCQVIADLAQENENIKYDDSLLDLINDEISEDTLVGDVTDDLSV